MLDVDDTVIKTMLPHVQRQYCRHAADQAAALLHSRCDAETPSGGLKVAKYRASPMGGACEFVPLCWRLRMGPEW